MKLPVWLRGATASTEDLEAQTRDAVRALDAARAALVEAQKLFDDSPSVQASQGLQTATDIVRAVEGFAQRAERLLEARKAQLEEERREKLRARVAEIDQLLTPAKMEAAAAPFNEKELELLEQLVTFYVGRSSQGRVFEALARERMQACVALGMLGTTVSWSDAVFRSRKDVCLAIEQQYADAIKRQSAGANETDKVNALRLVKQLLEDESRTLAIRSHIAAVTHG